MAEEIEISDLITSVKLHLQFLLKKKLRIMAFGFVCSIIVVISLWMMDSSYTAQMTFVAENDKSSKLGGYASIAAQFGIDLGGGGNSVFEGDNLVEFFKSRRLVDKTLLSPSGIGNGLMINWYVENYNMQKKWVNDDILSKVNFKDALSGGYVRKRDSVINKISEDIIKKRLEVDKVDKKLDIIYIKMQSNSQEFAKKFVEILAANAIDFYTEYKTKKSQANVNLLQHQTDSVRNVLFDGIGSAASINDLNVNPLKQTLRVPTQKAQINIQVSSAVYTELVKNLELSKLSLRKETPLIQIIDSPKLPLKNAKIGRLLGVALGLLSGFVLAIFYYSLIHWVGINSSLKIKAYK